jgi:hypothetical protein
MEYFVDYTQGIVFLLIEIILFFAGGLAILGLGFVRLQSSVGISRDGLPLKSTAPGEDINVI